MKPRFEKRAQVKWYKRDRIRGRRVLGDARIWWRLAWHTENPIQFLIDHGELPETFCETVSWSTTVVSLPITEDDLRALTGDEAT